MNNSPKNIYIMNGITYHAVHGSSWLDFHFWTPNSLLILEPSRIIAIDFKTYTNKRYPIIERIHVNSKPLQVAEQPLYLL